MSWQGDRRKLAEWQQRLRRFEKSGLTVSRFCARERVSVPTLCPSGKRASSSAGRGTPGDAGRATQGTSESPSPERSAVKQPLFCKCRDEQAGHLAFMLR
jgi:hypothetical protein